MKHRLRWIIGSGFAIVLVMTTIAPVYAYKYEKQKWPTNSAGFYLDIAGWDPALIQGPASTWNNAGSPFRFKLKGHNVYKPNDGYSTIGRYTLTDTDAIAVTKGQPGSTVTEIDTIFNMKYGWGCCAESDLYDVRNVMTHEFGHWLVLGDLYNIFTDINKTMYGLIGKGETKKRSLHQDDINGINYIY